LALTAAQATVQVTAKYLSAASVAVALDTQTILAQPTCPRNVVATPAGTTANVTAVSMTIFGTDESGATISEVLPAFTAGAATAVTGVKAFATISRITSPIVGAAVTVSVGDGYKFGIPTLLTRNTVLKGGAYLNQVREGTDPTVTTDTASLANNGFTLNSTPTATPIDLYYLVP